MWGRRACSMSMLRQLPGARALLALPRSPGALLLGRASMGCTGALCCVLRAAGVLQGGHRASLAAAASRCAAKRPTLIHPHGGADAHTRQVWPTPRSAAPVVPPMAAGVSRTPKVVPHLVVIRLPRRR